MKQNKHLIFSVVLICVTSICASCKRTYSDCLCTCYDSNDNVVFDTTFYSNNDENYHECKSYSPGGNVDHCEPGGCE
jgi:hypothetical protein